MGTGNPEPLCVCVAGFPARFLRASAQKGERVAYFFREGFVGDASLREGVTLVTSGLSFFSRPRCLPTSGAFQSPLLLRRAMHRRSQLLKSLGGWRREFVRARVSEREQSEFAGDRGG